MEMSSSLCCRLDRAAMNLATGPGAAAEESPAALSVKGALNGVAIFQSLKFPCLFVSYVCVCVLFTRTVVR